MKKYSEITLKSWQRAFVYTAIWLVSAAGFYLLADKVTKSILFHVAYVMLILPIATLAVTFVYTRRCGLKPWLIGYMALCVLVMYFFFGFDELSPNFILTNLICGFFGFGVGNIMKNEPVVTAQEDFDNKKKKLRQAQEKSYVSILNSESDTPDTKKRRK